MQQIATRKQPKNLVVDDNPVVRTTLKAVLEVNEFLVVTAANVAEALHLIDTEPSDVLLSAAYAQSRRRFHYGQCYVP